MSEDFCFLHVAGSNKNVDVVFIHGLKGSPLETWNNTDSKEPDGGYWPKWIAADIADTNVYTLGYPASIFARWAKKEMSLFERAKSALEHMAGYEIGKRPLIFVTHSLGGLLAKQILRTGFDSRDASWNAISSKCGLVMFLATPHTGSSLASLLHFSAPRIIGQHVTTLTQDSSQLDELNDAYRSLADRQNIQTVSYYEKYKTRNVALVVSKESADPGTANSTPIPLDADHESICKPEHRHSSMYISVKRRISQYVNSCRDSTIDPPQDHPAFEQDDYALRASHDRRDLQQKMQDAKREHEYSIANQEQNKFARNYYRLGLHTQSRQVNDNLLADVKQRFDSHVFLGKICQGASVTDITDTLQERVVDPLVEKYSSSTRATAQTIMQAVYFLTERCYIRWDEV